MNSFKAARIDYNRAPRLTTGNQTQEQDLFAHRTGSFDVHRDGGKVVGSRRAHDHVNFRCGTAVVRLACIRLAQRGEIELFHFEKRLRYTRDLLGAAVAHHFIHLGRNDLPGNAEFILEPAALLGFRNGG
jgi:hypothetical protein